MNGHKIRSRTLIAFTIATLIAGGNAIAIRFASAEIPPFLAERSGFLEQP